MEKNNEQKYKDFLSTISHELRTPLTSIRGFADTLLISYENLSDEQKTKFIKIIREQANRLIELVENILTASAANSTPSKQIAMKSVNPIKPLNVAVSLIKNRYKNHNFNVLNEADNYTVFADENKLQQVFINLLENACKYSPDNNNIDIKLYIYNDFYTIQIRDYGIGIAQEDFAKVFEKFSRIDNPLTRKTEGSGIGLFITKSIISNIGGTIKILPNTDKGTCFEIALPIYDAQIHSQKKFQGDKDCLKD